MSKVSDINQRADVVSSVKQNSQKALPKDINNTVSKVRLSMIDAFSKVSAFFESMKNMVLRKDATMSMTQIANQKAYNSKLALYNNMKLSSNEKAYLTFIGQKPSSLDELQELKKIDKDSYNFFKKISKNKDLSEIKSKLDLIKQNTPKNYSRLLVVANRFAKSQGASKEVKSFLKAKLQKNVVEKIKAFKNPDNIKIVSSSKDEFSTSPKEGLSRRQKIMIGAGLSLLSVGSIAGYYYLMPAAVTATPVLPTTAPGMSYLTDTCSFWDMPAAAAKTAAKIVNKPIAAAPGMSYLNDTSSLRAIPATTNEAISWGTTIKASLSNIGSVLSDIKAAGDGLSNFTV